MTESPQDPVFRPPEPKEVPLVNREIYQELRRIAACRMAGEAPGHTLQTTVLVHEAWLRLRNQGQGWRDPGHFFASASLTMRRILVDHARRKAVRRRVYGEVGEGLAEADPSAEHMLLINEGITAMEVVHPIPARVVIGRFFSGLSNKEIASETGMSERSVERHWAFAKVWLMRWIKSKH